MAEGGEQGSKGSEDDRIVDLGRVAVTGVDDVARFAAAAITWSCASSAYPGTCSAASSGPPTTTTTFLFVLLLLATISQLYTQP